MNTTLNPQAFNKSVETFAKEMGFKKADGTAKPISKVSESALETAIVQYLISDNKLKGIL